MSEYLPLICEGQRRKVKLQLLTNVQFNWLLSGYLIVRKSSDLLARSIKERNFKRTSSYTRSSVM